MTLQVQSLTLLVLLACGMGLGAVYDSYTVVLRHWKFLRFLEPVIDLSYWLISLGGVFYLLLKVNEADFRFYVYFLMLIGFVIYRVTLRKAVIQSTVGIVLAIGWICMVIVKTVQYFIINPILWILRTIYRILLALNRLLKYLEKIILLPFEWLILGGFKIFIWILSPILKPIRNWMAPFYERIRIKWTQYSWKWKELKSFVSNWLIRKDDDDSKPPL